MTNSAKDLPVFEVMDAIKCTLAENGTAVLIAPPGAGKTTAVPLALLGQAWLQKNKIIMLEPRRLAARTAAYRMAKTLGEKVGQTVGYRMRLDTKVSAATRVEIVTEGVFQKMILDDPELAGVGCVIFDEFHERSLDADFGLALTLEVREALRDDLRLLVMSATLDGERVTSLISDAKLIESEGRMYPVDIRYAPRAPDEKIETAMANCVRQMLREEEGSVLCFLPGQAEIRRTQEQLEGRLPANTFVAPLYGAMDIADQAVAVEPAENGKRKIVLATSLAETSITIDGVRIVIDSGLARLPSYEAALGISRLETKRASQASITQRAGRAGRTAPGIAIRLWSEAQTKALAEFEEPEIMQADLSTLVLNSLNWGANNISDLKMLDAPPAAHVLEAKKLLTALGAIDANQALTENGKRICESGLEPRLAAMVLAGKTASERTQRAFLALLLGERGLGGNRVDLSDRLERSLRDKSKRATQLRKLATRIARSDIDVDPKTFSNVGEMLCDAFPDRVAKQQGGTLGQFTMVNGRGVALSDVDPLASEQFIVVADLVGSAKMARVLSAAAIDESFLLDRFASDFQERDELTFDKQAKRLVRRVSRKLGAITFTKQNAAVEPCDAVANALIAAVQTHGLQCLDWTKSAIALYSRLKWLSQKLGSPWPDMSDTELQRDAADWLGPFMQGKTGFSELKPDELIAALMSRVPYELHRQIDELAPTHFEVPTGSKIPLNYDVETQPVLSVRVQELFGMATHPSIGGGQIPLVVELLSPAQRPIQITNSLPEFWQGSWRDVRADMRGRYPRHEWPEDPAHAAPTRRAKPRK